MAITVTKTPTYPKVPVDGTGEIAWIVGGDYKKKTPTYPKVEGTEEIAWIVGGDYKKKTPAYPKVPVNGTGNVACMVVCDTMRYVILPKPCFADTPLSLLFPPQHILDVVCAHSNVTQNIGRVTYLDYYRF